MSPALSFAGIPEEEIAVVSSQELLDSVLDVEDTDDTIVFSI